MELQYLILSATTVSYNVELADGTTEVPVVATATDANATISITDATSVPGSTVVTVTAEDGVATKTYTINFTVSTNYEDADGIMGGKLYSKFWATETGWTVPSGITEANITDYDNFYRCKQCHGWDLDGNTGAYINREPKTDRPSVAGSIRSNIASISITELFDDIKIQAAVQLMLPEQQMEQMRR